MKAIKVAFFLSIVCLSSCITAQTLQVKQGKTAIIKDAPSGNGNEITRLPAGTKIKKLGSVSRYYSVELDNCLAGYSYKGNLKEVNETPPSCGNTQESDSTSLMSRTDVLKIIVLDVEKGDATLIICPQENGEQDVLLIDTGESDDGQRIIHQLVQLGFTLSSRPITRFYVSHYDGDHIGSVSQIVPLSQMVYDHGDNNVKDYYTTAIALDNTDRRTMDINYFETFSGGVEVECVAINNATDTDPSRPPSSTENTNSMALIISYNGFDYFTGGDLTSSPERSLSSTIRDVDVYHVNHHGSSTTSSHIDFVTAISPEVSVVSNGTQYGHPRTVVADRLVNEGSDFFQTNINTDSLAFRNDPKHVGDDTYFDNNETEDAEGARGTIKIIVDSNSGEYYVMLPGLPFAECSYSIEHIE